MDLFDLVATLTLDTSQYDKALDQEEQNTGKFGNGWKKAGAVAAAGIAATTAAVGALTKQSVSAYAEYEQLAGGVEKIFDEANIDQIMADAGNAYKNLNMSANQYLAAINQTGAAFAQTMGDQKGYDTAKKGMQAIADYASGTGRNLDELNSKYSLITRSTSSYQSIADQFSGILPATSKGFLEQAQAAGLLSDSYTQLTQVPIEEYQEAVTNMLEKGVTDMGLYGNTAKESATTIQGSLAMTKSAWDNLVAGLANPDADMGQLMDNLIVAIVGDKEGTGLLNNIIPAIQRAVEGIGTFLQAAIPALSQQLPSLIQTFLPVVVQSLVALVTSIIQALPGIISTLVEMLPDIIDTVINGLVDAIIAATPILIKEAPRIIKALATGLLRAVGTLTTAAGKLLTTLGNAIKSGISSVSKKALSFAKQIPDKIKSGLGNLKSVGLNLIEGLWGGIKSKFDSVIGRVKALAAKLPSAVKKVLGISSPSKVFMEVGKWIPEGLALGIERNMKVVYNASDLMAGATAFTPESGTVSSGVQITNIFNVSGTEDPQYFADVVSDRLTRQLKLGMRTI